MRVFSRILNKTKWFRSMDIMNIDERSRKWGVGVETGTNRKKEEWEKWYRQAPSFPSLVVLLLKQQRGLWVGSSVINARECLVLSCPPISIGSFTVSPFRVSSSHALDNFFLISCLWHLRIKCFHLLFYSYLALSRPKCLYCEIFNPLQSVTLQLDEMSAV